ncbi:MAG: HAD family phosphatase [Spirulinaceae cyanobacterium RM2_2_10]|nr:HAD family phosphatase [Spirulinaceae cyanobacterium SM2_1_0]NJO19985.1 HAD family phosphatase [Spirulinaceae cyanobacterium RM2_2_10]
MDIRLVVLDIDGTIAGESNDISPAVREAVRDVLARGIPVAIATGRMYRSALRFYQALELQTPLIAYNGAWTQAPGQAERMHHQPLAPELVASLLDILEMAEWRSQIGVHCYIDDRLHVREVTDETRAYAGRSGIEPIAVGDLRQLLNQEITKVLTLCEDRQLIGAILAKLRSHYSTHDVYLTQSTPTFLEATHPQVNKGTAVRRLAEDVLGLQAEQVLAIGDNWNDAEMLDYAGIGVAMGSAPTGVKDIAQWVAPDVEADGVVAALAKFLP